MQRRAARFVTNRYHNTSSVSNMLTNLNWPSLQIRRTRSRLIMFYKIINNVVAIQPPPEIIQTVNTITRQGIHTYRHISTSKDSYKYSFFPRTVIQWNLLPVEIHSAASVDTFKLLIPVTVLIPIFN